MWLAIVGDIPRQLKKKELYQCKTGLVECGAVYFLLIHVKIARFGIHASDSFSAIFQAGSRASQFSLSECC